MSNSIEKHNEIKDKTNSKSNNDLNIPNHYDNSVCTLYKIADTRGWSSYLFDIVKRLERSDKKGEFNSDIDKSIVLLNLWKLESDKKLELNLNK